MADQAQRGQPIRRLIGMFILIIAVIDRSTLYAQLPVQALTAAAAASSGAPAAEGSVDSVRLLVGRSAIVDVGKPIARVSLTSDDIADALVTAPGELLVNGKAPGTISMFVWDRAGAIRRYEVVVQRDLARLQAQLKELFPKESIDVRANGKTAVLSGSVSSKDVADKMASLAGSFVDNKDELVSLLQVGEAGRSNQVLLRVRFAEVSRSAMTSLGVGLFTSPTGINNTLARITTDQVPAPTFDSLTATKADSSFGSSVTSASGQFTFSDFLNLFLYSEKFDLGAVVQALQTKGLFQSLAEPNLIAESGKEASFLAGGEFPIPVAQGTGGGTSISVQFKEFGIRLTFTPVVIGNRVHLKVRPEVSALDFTNAVSLNGFRIPALTTRRTETEVELNDGQTFAIAGLLNATTTSTMQKIPGIGDIPILGLLFKSKAAQKNRTELVVMITPEILPNNSPGVTPNLPALPEPYLPGLPQKQTVPNPPPAFRPESNRSEEVVPAKPTAAATPRNSAPGAGDGASAAATLSATSSVKRGPVVHVEAPTAKASTSASPAPAPMPTATAASTTAFTAGAASTATSASSSAAASASSAADTPNTPAATPPKLTARQEKALKQQEEADARAKDAENKRLAEQAAVQQRQQKAADERQAKLEGEKAARDAAAAKVADAAAKKQAARDAEAAKKQAALDAEAARKKAEIDKQEQKNVAEAEARLKAAQDAYQAELARQQHP